MFKIDINLNLYKTFYNIAKYGSISKAAHYYPLTSRPVISRSKKLKSEFDMNQNW